MTRLRTVLLVRDGRWHLRRVFQREISPVRWGHLPSFQSNVTLGLTVDSQAQVKACPWSELNSIDSIRNTSKVSWETFDLKSTLMAARKHQNASPKLRSSSSKDVSLKKVKGENFYRNAKQAARVKLLSGGKPVRDRDGKIIQAADFQKGEDETKPGRVQPDRRWFGVSPFTSLCDRKN